jgi:hypothetical protein
MEYCANLNTILNSITMFSKSDITQSISINKLASYLKTNFTIVTNIST